MRKLMTGLTLLLLGAMGASAANLVSVSNATGTTEYATITDALAACTGGETITLLGDVTVSGGLSVEKRVAVDLAGHTLKNNSGQFIKPTDLADGLSFRNGTIIAGDCCFAFQPGTYTVTVSNVVFEGNCMLYGTGGRLRYLEDCVSTCKYLISKDSRNGCSLEMWGGVVAPSGSGAAISNGKPGEGTQLTVYGGYFTQDPAGWIAIDSISERYEETVMVKGYACSYLVRKLSDDDEIVAEVIPAGGGESAQFSGLAAALTACTNGCTLRLLKDYMLNSTFTVSAGFTLDLNGHTLTSSGHAFKLRAGSQGFQIVNGTCESGNYGFMYGDSEEGDVTVSNCTLVADSAVFGPAGHATFIDSTLNLHYFTSYSTRMDILCTNCLVSCSKRVNDLRSDTAAPLRVQAGRYTHNMTSWLADGWSQIVDETTIDGVFYRYRVLPTAEAGTLDEAEAISADGATTNRYATISAAVSDCPENGTVRMLQNCTVDSSLPVPRNMTIDLCGLRLGNQSNNFIQPAAGVTLDIHDGDLYGKVSVFNVIASADVVVNATRCSIMGLCPVWGWGTLNTYSCWFRNLDELKSGNGGATMNVYDGIIPSLSRWHDGEASAGTKVNIYSAHMVQNPMISVLRDYLLAPGSAVYYEPYSYHNETYPHRIVDAAGVAARPAEAQFAGVYYTNVIAAAQNAGTENAGGRVTLLKTLTRQIWSPNVGSYVLDFGGNELAVELDAFTAQGGPLVLTNGAIRLTASSKSAILLSADAKLTVKAGFSLLQSVSRPSCGVYVPANNARLVFDGANVATARFISWGGGTGVTIEVVGDGSNTCNDVYWPGTAPGANSRLIVRGGWWKADPTAWVTNNHVVLRQAAATPCAWRVQPWADVCAKGWAFNPVDGVAVAQGTCDAAPTAPIVVSVAGDVPLKKTTLVDLKGLTFSAGTLTIDSFACDPDWPPTAKLTLTDGVLSVQNCLGTTVFIR